MTEAAKYLCISRGRLLYFLSNTANTENETLKGYTVSKITDNYIKVNRKSSKIEVPDIDTNEVTIYPSFTLAAEAMGVPRSSLSGYFAKNRTNPYRNKYILKFV